jgi:predicted transcriptional regulator
MSDHENPPRTMPFAAAVVTAYLSGNQLPASQLPDLIKRVHVALSSLDDDPAKQYKPEPMVSIKKSVGANHLVCLDCGRKLKVLKRHVRTAHRVSLQEYRAKWNLPSAYPATAANYSAQRSSLAKQIGLGTRHPRWNGKKNGRTR